MNTKLLSVFDVNTCGEISYVFTNILPHHIVDAVTCVFALCAFNRFDTRRFILNNINLCSICVVRNGEWVVRHTGNPYIANPSPVAL